MKTNVGKTDKVLRILLSLFLIILIALNYITGTWAVVLGIAAGIFLITAFAGRCGLYSLLGISTCTVKNNG